MPSFHGEKLALSLASPMVANLAVVKANNRRKIARYLLRSALMIHDNCGGDIEHFDTRPNVSRTREQGVVQRLRKLA